MHIPRPRRISTKEEVGLSPTFFMMTKVKLCGKRTMPSDVSINLVAQIVSAYVRKNPVLPPELPSLIQMVHRSLLSLDGETVQQPAEQKQQPAVAISKSVTDDFIICLEDGKKFQSMRRYLGARYKMTPEKYREKWNLPADYPMVARKFAAKRSYLAKQSGLGRQNEPRTA